MDAAIGATTLESNMTEEAKAEAVAKAPKRGIGTVIKEAILAGKDNQEALDAAKAEFPEASTTLSTVSWYRNDLRKNSGQSVPTARDLKKSKAAAAPAAPAAPAEAQDPLE